ncbi:MAG TPA: CDP-diacylglycerol--glycerol-3-phosphate 3-phosphatidyltransferase [Streptosporangiaceae bacterium]|nr:CDP-diacylglycerol--glycerol-3-phosphate 3-phosphatidyltransferase [Streptosporangiaceae bacterium]
MSWAAPHTDGDGTAPAGPGTPAGGEPLAPGSDPMAAGRDPLEVPPDPAAASQAADSARLAAPRLVNVANALTVARLALVPVFIYFLLAGGTADRAIAFVAFAVASATDLLDGELARRRNLITDFGKIADPIADKALTGSALITLSYLGELPWWITAVIVIRELGVTALRFWVIRRGVIAASRGGKLKTMLQIIAISLYVLPWHVDVVRAVAMAAALVVTVVTGADYTVRAIRLRRAVR